ncbi:MAG: SDR family NAD(P)-dependent oxidoreductase [Pseudomonadota bacterium]
MQSVVVTGVSTGIGYATTEVLLKHDFRVFGSVRKQGDAQRLVDAFGSAFVPLIFDVTDKSAIERGAAQVRDALNGRTLSGVVNNAGVAVAGPLLEMPVEDFQRQLDINVLGPFLVNQAFGPLLGTDPALHGEPGRIINISSVAGKKAMPFLGPYATSKFGLEGYSDALRREMLLFGIDVIVIGPGPVQTPIWDKADELDVDTYADTPYFPILERFKRLSIESGHQGYPASRIGELIYTALTIKNPKTRYAAVKGRFLEKAVMRAASPRALDKLIARTLGISRLAK